MSTKGVLKFGNERKYNGHFWPKEIGEFRKRVHRAFLADLRNAHEKILERFVQLVSKNREVWADGTVESLFLRLVSSANEKVGKEEANVFAKVVIRYYVDEEERDRLVDFCKKNEIPIQVPDEPKKEF